MRRAPALLRSGLVAASVALAGCSSGVDAGTFALGAAAGAASAGAHGFADRAPVAFPAPAPQSFPVHGVDVAKYQGTIDWPRLRASGVSFAFIKATEGGDRLDRRFHENWRAARAAGVLRGAYHFHYWCRPAAEQAAWFIRNVPRERGALPPVLDVEWNGHSPTCPITLPAERARSEMRTFLHLIERHYGQRPVIYSTVDFHRDVMAGHFEGYDHWLRSTKDHVRAAYPGRAGRWTFWQYTATGRAPGVDADLDLNAFRGSERAWRRWVRRRVR